jgi:hypothetical protein
MRGLWSGRRRVLSSGLLTLPFHLHQVLEQLRNRPTALENFSPLKNFGVDRKTDFYAELIGGFWFATFVSHFIG